MLLLLTICQEIYCDRGAIKLSTTTLEKFIDLFQDEAALREALLFLWSQVPGVTGVRQLHSGLEHGKDIVFFYQGPAGESMLCACVVKKEKISGSASAPGGAMTVVSQARQALGNPYLNPKGGEERVERVYIICPHPVLPIAMASIKGELELRAGQVVFCCGNDLLQLFEQHAPSFIVAKSGLLAAYLADLRRQFDEDKAFANIAFKHGVLPNAKRALSKAYVEPGFALAMFRYSIRDGLLPQLWRFEKEVWAADIKEAEQSCQSTARLLEMAADYGLLRLDGPTGTRSLSAEVSQLGRHLSKAWDQAYTNYRIDQEHKGVHVIPSRVQLTLNGVAQILEDGKQTLSKADQHLQGLRANISCHRKLTRTAAADPLRALRSDDGWLLPSLHDLASELSGVILVERRTPIRLQADSLSSAHRALLITGGAGFGKTTFCRWQTIRDGERFIARESNVMPIYVPLHTLAQGPLGTFDSAFLPDPEFHRVLSETSGGQTRLRLYLDGLDEVPTRSRQEEIIQLVRTELLRTNRVDIVITARDHVRGPWLTWLPHVQLSELPPDQVRELVTQLLAPDTGKVEEFFCQLAGVPTLQSLTGVPLLTMLMVAAYQSMESLPENRVELYRIFVDLLCGGWDIAKGIRRGTDYGPSLKVALLMRLASTLHHDRSRDATRKQIRDVIQDVAPGLKSQWELVLGDILQDGLVVQNGSTFAFRHLSFQEYLAARDLADPTNHKQDQTLGWYFQGEDWWREVLTFYIGLSNKPLEVSRWLDSVAAKIQARGAKDTSQRLATMRRAIEDAFPNFC